MKIFLGIYQCVAVNPVGRIWAAAQVVPTSHYTPSPPENVQCRPFDDSSICLSWQPPQNVSIIGYQISCSYIGKMFLDLIFIYIYIYIENM